MTLPTIQLKLLQRLMQHVKSTHVKRLLLFSNHIPLHGRLPFLDEFAEALNQADAVYLAQIYGSAREVDHGDVKVEDLEAKIIKTSSVITAENVSPLLDHDNAVYVFMGAGDIQLYERSFEELLASLQTHM